MKLKFVGSIVIGVLLGTMYYNTGNDGTKVFNTAGLMFTLMVFIIIIAKTPTVLTFPLQRTIFEREHRNGWYSTKMYYLATTLAEMPYQIIGPTINCGLLYWLSGQPPEWHRLFLFIVSGILVALIAESIGFMIGAATDVQNGIFISCLTAGACMLLCGFFLPSRLTPVHLRWLYRITYTRYSLGCFLHSVFQNRPRLPCEGYPCSFKDPKTLMKYFSLEDGFFLNCSILLLYLISFRIISCFILVYRTSRLR